MEIISSIKIQSHANQKILKTRRLQYLNIPNFLVSLKLKITYVLAEKYYKVPEVFSEPCHTSKMERSVKITKRSTLDI